MRVEPSRSAVPGVKSDAEYGIPAAMLYSALPSSKLELRSRFSPDAESAPRIRREMIAGFIVSPFMGVVQT